MTDSNLHGQHGQTSVGPERRLALDAMFTPKGLVLRPRAEATQELLELAESYARDNDRLREVRFYTKRFAHRSYDVLIRVPDRRCSRWESGRAADKAQDGIARLEGKRTVSTTIHHCASCAGGAIWSVRW
jgi:hypothetical protein